VARLERGTLDVSAERPQDAGKLVGASPPLPERIRDIAASAERRSSRLIERSVAPTATRRARRDLGRCA
jgi:hypothetical protein